MKRFVGREAPGAIGMQASRFRAFAAAAAVVVLVVSVMLATPGQLETRTAQVNAAVPPDLSAAVAAQAAPPAQASQRSESSSGAPSEGIKVHGHWTIRVVNPDGSVAETRDFENALADGNALSAILGRQATPGTWAVRFGENPVGATVDVASGRLSVAGPCALFPGSSSPGPCTLTERDFMPIPDSGNPTSPDNNLNIVFPGIRIGDLTLNAPALAAEPTMGPHPGQIVLAGSGSATGDGSITFVETWLALCAPDFKPNDSCSFRTQTFTAFNFRSPGFPRNITRTTLANPISVAQGQTVQITVVISFS